MDLKLHTSLRISGCCRERSSWCAAQKAVKLQPKVFDTLVMLVENHGRLVEKDNFLKGLWPDTFVEEATLAHCVSELRRTLRAGERWNGVYRDCCEARDTGFWRR